MKNTDTLVNSITILSSLCTSVLTYRTLEIAIWLGIDTSKNPATKRRLRKIRNEMDVYKNPRSGIIVAVLGILLIAYVMQCVLSISPILFAGIVILAVVCNLWQFTMDLKKYGYPAPQTSNGRERLAAQKRKETARKKIIVDIIVFVIIIITTIVSLIELPSITYPADTSSSTVSSSTVSSSTASSSDVSSSTVSSDTPPTESANTQTVTPVKDMQFDGFKYTGEVMNYGGQLRPHGQGTASYDDGSVYEGGWKYGKKHGAAKFWSSKGWFFQGEFLANEKDTKGTHENYPDGHGAIGTYEGTVIDGKFEGEATFEYETGEKFVGTFSANEQWDGTFYNGDGSVLYRVKDGKRVS